MARSDRTRFLAAVLALALTACNEVPTPTVEPVHVTDSAGVRIVKLPSLAGLDVPEWRARRLYSTERTDLELYQVRDALFLSDSSLVVANSGSAELIVLDVEGNERTRFGQKGEGPGEYGYIRRVLRSPEGDLAVFDTRITLVTEEGDLVGTRRFDPPSYVVSVEPLVMLSDGDVLGIYGEQRHFQAQGELRDTVPLLLYQDEGSDVDTLGVWMGLERAFASLGPSRALVPIGFARTVLWDSRDQRVALGSTDALDLTILDGATPRLRIVGAYAAAPVTPEDAARWRRALMDELPTFATPDFRKTWEAAPVRETYPAFGGLAVDSQGRTWIGEYARPETDKRTWLVLAPDGLPAGRVQLPVYEYARLPGRHELLDAIGDRVALLRTNELEEEFIEVWVIEVGQ